MAKNNLGGWLPRGWLNRYRMAHAQAVPQTEDEDLELELTCPLCGEATGEPYRVEYEDGGYDVFADCENCDTVEIPLHTGSYRIAEQPDSLAESVKWARRRRS